MQNFNAKVGWFITLIVVYLAVTRSCSCIMSNPSSPAASTDNSLDDATEVEVDEMLDSEIVKRIIASQLRVPRSVEFAPMDEWIITPVAISLTPEKTYKMYQNPTETESVKDIETKYVGWVESQNDFGTQVRDHFEMRLRTANVPDGYLERAENLRTMTLYGKSTRIPTGKVEVRYFVLNGETRVGLSDRVFYERTTGILTGMK